MTDAAAHTSTAPSRWQVIAERLEQAAAGPTLEQVRVAQALDVTLPDGLPAPVAAIVLNDVLSGALLND